MPNPTVAERSEAPPPPEYHYSTFEDWFHELENYSNRSERFYEELQWMDHNRKIEWLRAAFECGRMKPEKR